MQRSKVTEERIVAVQRAALVRASIVQLQQIS
jgi:hypothetical protein